MRDEGLCGVVSHEGLHEELSPRVEGGKHLAIVELVAYPKILKSISS